MAIIANGLLVAEALEAAKTLKEEGISARVINMATIKPLDEELVLKAAQECGKVITCEEHNILGGLGEAVCGVLSEKLAHPRAPHRRQRRVRPLRPRRSPAQAVRPVRRAHR